MLEFAICLFIVIFLIYLAAVWISMIEARIDIPPLRRRALGLAILFLFSVLITYLIALVPGNYYTNVLIITFLAFFIIWIMTMLGLPKALDANEDEDDDVVI